MTRKKILIGASALLLVAVAGLVMASGLLVKPLLEIVLRQNGFPNARIDSVAVIPSGLVLEDIALDGEGFSTIKAVQVTGSWPDLIFNKKIVGLNIKDAEISGELDEDGQIVIAGWNASFSDEPSSDKPLVIEAVSLEGMTLDFETPQGAIRIEGKLSLQSKADKTRDFQANIWSKQKQLSLSAVATGTFLPDGSWTSDIELQEGRLDLGGVKASRSTGTITLAQSAGQPLSYKGKILAGGLKIQETPFQDFILAFDSAAPDMLSFSISPTGYNSIVLAGRVYKTSDAAMAELIGKVDNVQELAAFTKQDAHDLDALKNFMPLTAQVSTKLAQITAPDAEAEWVVNAGADKALAAEGTLKYSKEKSLLSGTIAPFSLPAANLSALLPDSIGKEVELNDGSLAVSGSFSTVLGQSPAKVDGNLTLEAKKIGGLLQDYPFSLVSGTVKADQLWPWQLEKDQTLKIGAVGTGVNLTDGKIVFTGTEASGLAVKSANFAVAGGSLSTLPFRWSFKEKRNDLTLQIKDIDMKTIADTFDSNGFTAEGKFSGTLPVTFSDKNGITFKGGLLKTNDGGRFSYAPETFPAALQGDDARMQTVRTALSDFRYSAFEISIEGSLDGSLKTGLKAVGKNPTFADRPINLNINLEGALLPALQQALQPGRIADNIEKSISGD